MGHNEPVGRRVMHIVVSIGIPEGKIRFSKSWSRLDSSGSERVQLVDTCEHDNDFLLVI